MNRKLADAVRQAADATIKPSSLAMPMSVITGTVTTVAAGAAMDGNAQVTVTLVNGDTTDCWYPDSYTPTVSDVVLVGLPGAIGKGKSPVILLHLIGQPTVP
jgi:hypothetical protein